MKGTTVYRSGSRGNEPLTPLTIEEAIQHLESKKSDFIIGAAQSDCPKGICDLESPIEIQKV